MLEEIAEINDDYENQIQDADEQGLILNGMKEIESTHKRVTDKIRSHLELRANETRSDVTSKTSVSVTQSQASTASRASAASKEAQIGARLEQIRLKQLERRLEKERKIERQQQEAQRQQQEAQCHQQEVQRELERSARLADARDAVELAAKEAELRKAAESDLTWDRVDDFCGETAVAAERLQQEPRAAGNTVSQQTSDEVTEMCQPSSVGSNAPVSHTVPLATAPESGGACQAVAASSVPIAEQTLVTSAEVHVIPPSSSAHPAVIEPKRTPSKVSWIHEVANRPRNVASAEQVMGGSHRSVPQIQLPKFIGKAIEWPQWIGLFKTMIHDQRALTNSEKLAHLQSSVAGIAKQAAEGMLFDGDLYPVALQTLMDRFGREGDIVNANFSAVFGIPPMKEIDLSALERLYAAVHCAVTVLENMGFDGDLNSTENLRRVVLKLPNELKRDWGRKAIDIEPKRANLQDFDRWLGQQVRIVATVPVRSFESNRPPRRESSRSFASRAPSGPVALATAPKMEPENQTPLQSEYESQCSCGGRHKLDTCPTFLQRAPEERAKFVGESGRCFACLKHGHRSRQCNSAEKCGEGGCQGRHHRTLHGSGESSPIQTAQEAHPVDEQLQLRCHKKTRRRCFRSCQFESMEQTALWTHSPFLTQVRKFLCARKNSPENWISKVKPNL